MTKTSNIWEFFTKANDDKATCNECHKEFIAKQGYLCIHFGQTTQRQTSADLFSKLERKDADRMRTNDTFEVDSNDSELQSLIGPLNHNNHPPKSREKNRERGRPRPRWSGIRIIFIK